MAEKGSWLFWIEEGEGEGGREREREREGEGGEEVSSCFSAASLIILSDHSGSYPSI